MPARTKERKPTPKLQVPEEATFAERAELRKLEEQVRHLEDRLTAARQVSRDAAPGKHDIASVIATQRPNLEQLRHYISYR